MERQVAYDMNSAYKLQSMVRFVVWDRWPIFRIRIRCFRPPLKRQNGAPTDDWPEGSSQGRGYEFETPPPLKSSYAMLSGRADPQE
jgi:hypothetical protein